jgi:glycosyltransferase involved in cell wall biosynthesis
MDDKRTPLLILGDSPSGRTGLGRILRDVASLTTEHLGEIFDVATIGGGAPPSGQFKFREFPMMRVSDWIVHDLPYVWTSHVGNRDGILLCIWDVSRLLWMAYPEQCTDPSVASFMKNFKGKKWIYPAIDAAGPNDTMPVVLADALKKFDRVLNYTKFSAAITGYPDVATHGIATDVFYHRPDGRAFAAKYGVKLESDEKLIGIVATNQPRKDWGLAFEVLKELKKSAVKAKVWVHTDVDVRHWNLPQLYADFDLFPEIKIFFGNVQQLKTGEMMCSPVDDEILANMYSACDVTLGIGPEGWGLPLSESLACGTPVVAGSYGGQSDFVPHQWLVEPSAMRYEGVFAVKRPVYDAADMAQKISDVLRQNPSVEPCVIESIGWNHVWKAWQSWLLKGVE